MLVQLPDGSLQFAHPGYSQAAARLLQVEAALFDRALLDRCGLLPEAGGGRIIPASLEVSIQLPLEPLPFGCQAPRIQPRLLQLPPHRGKPSYLDRLCPLQAAQVRNGVPVSLLQFAAWPDRRCQFVAERADLLARRARLALRVLKGAFESSEIV
ncbi:hypothetical protein [Pseudomonas aeruginosa]|uniref:hypothetical protein n=2 Tax=Pseudomonas aeruginosa TaxID=287 RepID=UPI0015E70529|nr:hypothetical protein [Pseudomonas aeruginosa]